MKRFSSAGFTLIELLVVITVIALLASMVAPQLEKAIDRAQSVTCMGNLRQLGIAVQQYVADNDGTFPFIEPNVDNPVYPTEDTDLDPKPILVRLEPYGLTSRTLRCPTDVKARADGGKSYFEARDSSYQWRPYLDGEEAVAPTMYGRRGARTVRLSRMRICMDYFPGHFNRCNYLYADGRAEAKLK